jgi:hypothetical protein
MVGNVLRDSESDYAGDEESVVDRYHRGMTPAFALPVCAPLVAEAKWCAPLECTGRLCKRPRAV